MENVEKLPQQIEVRGGKVHNLKILISISRCTGLWRSQVFLVRAKVRLRWGSYMKKVLEGI